MTVLEALVDSVQTIDSIRLPVIEAANILQLTKVADNLRACINVLSDHQAETKDGTEPPEEMGDLNEEASEEDGETYEQHADV